MAARLITQYSRQKESGVNQLNLDLGKIAVWFICINMRISLTRFLPFKYFLSGTFYVAANDTCLYINIHK